jgi:hypothetical protein
VTGLRGRNLGTDGWERGERGMYLGKGAKEHFRARVSLSGLFCLSSVDFPIGVGLLSS